MRLRRLLLSWSKKRYVELRKVDGLVWVRATLRVKLLIADVADLIMSFSSFTLDSS